VSLAGKYRLIDIPISNCINSDIYKIYVLTQFNSTSLNQHVARTYHLSNFHDGFVEILAAQQTPENPHWFQGTTDAVRQYLTLFKELDVDDYLILSGDHLYRMDYRQFVQRHRDTAADLTIAVISIDQQRASDFGLVQIDADGRIIGFSEKPQGEALEQMRADTQKLGLSPEEAAIKSYIASMGIYVFKRDALIHLLEKFSEQTDFGKEIIPTAVQNLNVQAYCFNGYWEDIGTIEAFYKANLALTQQPHPPFSFYDDNAPIYTRARYLPPTKLLDCHICESIVGDGCVLKNCQVHHSVLGIRSQIESGCVIENSLIMGADFYQPFVEQQTDCGSNTIPVDIGANTTIRNAIIDKNARIGCNVQIVNPNRIQECEREEQGFYISNGITVVFKNATIQDGTVI
jgi:glucose-1-phosphate adenylyltransferase